MKNKIDWKYWTIMSAILIGIIFMIIPKVTIEIIDKRPLQEWTCNCNCEYPQEQECFNWSNVEPIQIPSYWNNWTYYNYTTHGTWNLSNGWFNDKIKLDKK